MALVKIQVRRDTAANWTATNPVLSSGEFAHETDTGKIKIGDGVRNWASLPYATGLSLSSSATSAIGSSSPGTSSTAARGDHSHALPPEISCGSLTVSGNSTVGGTLTVAGALIGGAHTQSASTITDLSEAVDDRVAALLQAGTGVTLAYNDSLNTLTISATGGTGGTGGAVSSVAGRTGAVVLSTADLADFGNAVENASASFLVGIGGITVDHKTASHNIEIGIDVGGTYGGGPSAPAVPTSVSGAAGNTSVTVSWTAGAGAGVATDYAVQYSADAGVTWLSFAHAASAATTLSVTGLTNGSPYRFRVAGVNATGQSAWSTPTGDVVPQAANAPPTDILLSGNTIAEGNAVAAVIGTLSAVDETPSDTFTFSLVSGSGSTGNSAVSIVGAQLKAAASYVYATASSYSIRVRATDSSGLYVEKVFTIFVTESAAQTPPAAPSGLTAAPSITTVALAWTAPSDGGSPITGYSITWRKAGQSQDDGSATAPPNAVSATVSGLLPNTAYTFSASAINKKGPGAAATASATTGQATITIVSQPEDAESLRGSVTFSVSASCSDGSPVSYQWFSRKAGGAWAAIVPAQTSDTLQLDNLSAATDHLSGYKVRCAAATAASVDSSEAVLTVVPYWYSAPGPFANVSVSAAEVRSVQAAASGIYALAANIESKTASANSITRSVLGSNGSQYSAVSTPDYRQVRQLCGSPSLGFLMIINYQIGGLYSGSYADKLLWSGTGESWTPVSIQDGTWTSQAQPTFVAMSSTSALVFYGGSSGDVYRVSSDGLNWSGELPSRINADTGAFGPANGQLIPSDNNTWAVFGSVVGSGAAFVGFMRKRNGALIRANKIAYSLNGGASWSVATTPINPVAGWRASCFCGGKWFLFGAGNQYVYSTNMASWTVGTLPFTDDFDLCAAGGDAVAVMGADSRVAVCKDATAPEPSWVIESSTLSGAQSLISHGTRFEAMAGLECSARDFPPPASSTPSGPSDRAAAAPQNLAASTSSAGATMTWDPPASFGSAPLDFYKAQYKRASEVTWIDITLSAPQAREATIGGLAANTAYQFRVAASTARGAGAYAQVAASTTATPVGDGPTNVTAEGVDLYYDQTTQAAPVNFLSTRLTWTPAASGNVTSERLQFKSSNNYYGHVIGQWYDILTTGEVKDYVAPVPSAAAGGKRSSLVTFGWYNSQAGQIHQFRVGSVYNNNNAQTVWSEPFSWRNSRYNQVVTQPPPPGPVTTPTVPTAASLAAANPTAISRTVSGTTYRWIQFDLAWTYGTATTTKFVVEMYNGKSWVAQPCVDVLAVSNFLYALTSSGNVWSAGMASSAIAIPASARTAQLTLRIAGGGRSAVFATGDQRRLRLVAYNGAIVGPPSNEVTVTIP